MIANGALLATVTVTDGDGDTATQSVAIGNLIKFEDDGPSYTSASDGVIGNIAGQVEGNIVGSFGADGPGSILLSPLVNIPGVTYSAPAPTANGGQQIVATTTSSSGPVTFFTLTWFPDGKYVFDLVTPRPVTLQPNLLANFAPGIYDTVTTGGVTFDGLAFSSTGPTNFTNTNANPERLNVSGGGFGIGNANLDDNEGFMFVRSGTDALGFDLIFQTATTINVSWAAYGGGTPPTSASVPTQTGSLVVNDDADHTVPVTIDPTADFNYIVVRFDLSGAGECRTSHTRRRSSRVTRPSRSA